MKVFFKVCLLPRFQDGLSCWDKHLDGVGSVNRYSRIAQIPYTDMKIEFDDGSSVKTPPSCSTADFQSNECITSLYSANLCTHRAK